MPFGFNIDIHCHPSTKPFMSGVTAKEHTPFETYKHQIENPLLKALGNIIERFSEVRLATQSNFDSLFEGEFRVVIASITPLERAFLVVNNKKKDDFTDLLVFQTKAPFEGTVKLKAVNAITGFGMDDVKFVRGSGSFTNYYKQGFEEEYKFLTATDGQKSPLHGYTVKFVKNFNEIQQGIDSGENAIYVLISIEGAHALSTLPPLINDIAAGQGQTHIGEVENNSKLPEFDANIKELKQLPFVPFFVTPLHHFWNGLGGHARSLNKLVGELLSQSEGINIGLTKIGTLVIKLLLSTDNGKRILIDVKHMSARSRKDYYALLKTPEFAGQGIPIISSHGGISSRAQTLDEFINQDDKAEENNNRNYLHECSINLCKEDIIIIAASGGLIGIQMDEKRVAGRGFIETKLRGGLTKPQIVNEYSKLLMANIFTAVAAVGKVEAWDLFSIGSDFDGLINHLDCCPDAAHIPLNIKQPLLDFLRNPTDIEDPLFDFSLKRQTMIDLMFGLSPEEIVDKIFAGNVMNFLKKNFK